MSRFIDVYLDRCVPGYPCMSSPRWSTSITHSDSGAEQANQRWEHPLHRYTLPEAVRDHDVYEAVRDHWLITRGPLRSFPFRDPLDFASRALSRPNQIPPITFSDQVLGTGDGIAVAFQLVKTYTRGAETYIRKVVHPVVSTVIVSINNADPLSGGFPNPWTVDRLTGVVTFSNAPAPGAVVRAGYLYDVEVRFESDESFDGLLRDYGVSGFADLVLVEIRPC
jgi:uncharacterized protein (TIGR02217 family)